MIEPPATGIVVVDVGAVVGGGTGSMEPSSGSNDNKSSKTVSNERGHKNNSMDNNRT